MKRSGFFLLVIIAVCLLFTNPETDDYVEWTASQLKKDQNKFIEIGVDLAVVPYVSANTERSNWYLFSIYSTKSFDGKVITSVGVGENFFVLSNE